LVRAVKGDATHMPDLSLILAILAETQTLTLATLDPDGLPRATPLFFAFNEKATLVFVSERDTQHCRNLERQPSVAAAVYPDVHDWRELRGLQIKGFASLVSPRDRDAAMALYASRFPFVDTLADVLGRSEAYHLRPSWVRLIDNRQGFGYKREWTLG
jgi:uncharacterized protein YhbP (UPF0306 family)